jgi:hypothetical protein
MIDTPSILETALSIRPDLRTILGQESGLIMLQQLDSLLREVETNEDVADNIWELLTDTRETQTWVTDFQKNHHTEKSAGKDFGSNSMSCIAAIVFKCPQCDETWSRDRIGRPTPVCSTHNIPLEKIV